MKFLILVLSCFIHSLYAVPHINKCKASDKKCLIATSQTVLSAFVKGLPEHGVPVCDPIYLEKGKSDSPGLSISYEKINVYGLSKAQVVNLNHNSSHIDFVIKLPLNIHGNYKLKGKILILEVIGDGIVDINTANVGINMVLKKQTVKGADGKDHWKISGFDYTYDLFEKVNIELTGLFGGDEEKAKPFKNLISENYVELIEDLGKPIIKDVLSILVKYVNHIFKDVPCEDLELY